MLKWMWRSTAALTVGMTAAGAAQAQAPPAAGTPPVVHSTLPRPGVDMDLPVPMITGGLDSACGCGTCSCDPCGCGAAGSSLYGAAEFLYMRPHFSEAMAFARVNTITSRVDGQELEFEYDPSYRLRLGSWLSCGSKGLRGTYWHLDTDINENGVAAGPVLIVDPFGNLAPAGASISTEASVAMNVYDLEFISSHAWDDGCTTLAWTVGARFADVEQYYDSLITIGAVPVSFGDFSADFIGAGPRMGLEAAYRQGPCSPLSLFGSVHGALLLGEYDVQSSNTILLASPPAGAAGEQHQSLTRTIPVIDMELGVAWQVEDRWSVAAGWMFQAWFDLGTSGGRFENGNPPFGNTPLFTGADDSNIMSFDGLFLRAEMGF